MWHSQPQQLKHVCVIVFDITSFISSPCIINKRHDDNENRINQKHPSK